LSDFKSEGNKSGTQERDRGRSRAKTPRRREERMKNIHRDKRDVGDGMKGEG
jgi:hypothetical protein